MIGVIGIIMMIGQLTIELIIIPFFLLFHLLLRLYILTTNYSLIQ